MANLDTGNACEFRLVPRLSVLTPSRVRKQYVNLGGRGDQGRILTLFADVVPEAPGQTVTFEFTAGEDNIDPEELDEGNRAGFAAAATGAAAATTTADTNDDGVARIEFRVSTHGGDTFIVRASIPGSDEESGEITVWRKIYYEINTMEDAPDGTSHDLDTLNLESELARTFIEAMQIEPVDSAPYSALLDKPNARSQVAERFGAERSPNQIAVYLGSRLGREGPQRFTGQATADAISLGAFEPWRADDWFVSGTATEYELADDGSVDRSSTVRTVTIEEDDITLRDSTSNALRKFARMDLSGNEFDYTGNHVEVVLNVKKLVEIGVAWRNTPYLFIPVGSVRAGNWTRSDQDREVMAEGILLHEVAHKVLMVTNTSDYWYNSPGVGNHCMYPHESAGAYDSSETHNCTMHHTALGVRAFCDGCVASLRKNLIRGSDVSWTGTRGDLAGGAEEPE